MTTTPTRYRLYGLLAVVLVAAVAASIIGAYNQVFTPVVTATVLADRSGLLTDPGADVTVRGVPVGEVREVLPDGDGAALTIALDQEQAEAIPAGVTAEVVAPTVFGAKFVNLVLPGETPTLGGPATTASATARTISAGAVIQRAAVPTEINPVFEHLVSLLDSVDVAQLNSTLGALSTGLQGRGARIGDLAGRLETYLAGLEPSVPALADDLGRLGRVSKLYADVAPDLLATADNAAEISDTLVDEQLPLQAFLVDVSGFADDTRGFLAENEQGLRNSLGTLAPVTALTARYSPEFTCLLASTNQLRRTLEPIIGGGQAGIHLLSSVLPSQQGYRNPRDLPQFVSDTGPSCYGGPVSADSSPTSFVKFDDGSQPFDSTSDGLSAGRPPLAVQLFGEDALLGGAR